MTALSLAMLSRLEIGEAWLLWVSIQPSHSPFSESTSSNYLTSPNYFPLLIAITIIIVIIIITIITRNYFDATMFTNAGTNKSRKSSKVLLPKKRLTNVRLNLKLNCQVQVG